jgi:hypothetical protein
MRREPRLQRPNSFLSPALRGGASPDGKGRGVFATQPIRRGMLLAVWGGDVLTRAELDREPPSRRLVLQIDEDHFLLSTCEGPADWINHSCAPNAGLLGQVSLVALRDIAPGEEICFDYATSDGCDYDEFDCCCGGRECRGRIRGDDWRRPELQRRYRGHFAPYLQQRIDALGARARRRTNGSPRVAAESPTAVRRHNGAGGRAAAGSPLLARRSRGSLES